MCVFGELIWCLFATKSFWTRDWGMGRCVDGLDLGGGRSSYPSLAPPRSTFEIKVANPGH